MQRTTNPVVLLACVFLLVDAGRAREAEDRPELVRNPAFAGEGAEAPEGWTVWKPVWEQAACRVGRVEDGLRIDAPGRPDAVGGVYQDVAGIRPGQAYAIRADYRAEGFVSEFRSIQVRLTWTRGGDPLHPAGVLARGPFARDGRSAFADTFVAPAEADGARVGIEVKWPRGATVAFTRVSLRPCDPPPPRKVKVGTVFLRPRQSTPQRNLDLFCGQIDAAGELGLDIVCLGEAITMVGTSQTINDVAEPIPGPATEKLGEAARKNKLWVVAGLTEREGERVYNTAVLLDREGRLAGTYRKVHLPREEWKQGVTPGDAYPVFRTEFGTVAIQICYDWFFPEATALFAAGGAEIVFAPTWGDTLPDEDGMALGETVFRVRARDNGVYLVPSVYDGNSMVIDPMGRILASNNGREGVFWCEIDLNRRERLAWVGHWGSIGPRHRMPETYGRLLAK